MNLLDMKGRHAVITGGATGLGFAIAQRMLASGARVTIWDRDVAGMSAAADALRQQVAGAVVNTVQVDVAAQKAAHAVVGLAPVQGLGAGQIGRSGGVGRGQRPGTGQRDGA